ncbi:trans-aconitate 2-methyltransferase [Streptomyces sp. ISL-11]|uniref:trans-aconitate 2-methyltransferase n=1 Tax=Streptomyces sp. ISL-11 TaxID=2819174 RepID=UPI001BE6B9B1|nr:trans-aconitate 2-methyltransferase [Streptomyces sp. ISL-11]MBT2386717.1 trans-aconitate 2-methyltransferase [Streptomyces sp. ISL-11]
MHSAPAWDPHQYLRHSGHRNRPFHDLLARVPELPRTPARIVDLGCGTGNLTALLAARRPDAHVTGLDNSPDMLAEATAYAGPSGGGGSIDFAHADIGDWRPAETFDLIISNAALQWVPDHTDHFTRWVDALAPGGTFAFQVPGNFAASSHALLRELCGSPRWRDRLGETVRASPVLDPADYLALLAGLGLAVDAWETTYLQVLPGEDAVLDWVKGTALRPVFDALADDREVEEFLAVYGARLREAYLAGADGTVFPFRRIFVVARKRG